MPANENVLVEVCADSVASAVAAERGGGSRIELCSGLAEGGITPSVGLMEEVRAAVSIRVRVMIRPRGGDFCYDENEFKIMQRDIEAARKAGMDGVVLGILDLNGNVDVNRTRQLAELARPMQLTFHRAFDMTADLFRALEDVREAGADRVLTSGGEQTAMEGQATIQRLVKQSCGRITIMAGSGIKPENARRLIEVTGAKEIHVGLRSSTSSPMQYRNPRIRLGAAEDREYQRVAVLEENVARLCRAIRERE
jgi:copper homeostasis protein